MARHYVAAAAVAVLVAVALATPAFAAKASLTPSVHHVKCPDTAVSVPVFCETVTFTNTAGIGTNGFQIHITVFTITGTNDVDFSGSNGADCFDKILSKGESCLILVHFDPSATGHRSATATVFEDTLNTSTSVGLAGTGT